MNTVSQVSCRTRLQVKSLTWWANLSDHMHYKNNRSIAALRSFMGFHRFILELREPNFIRTLSIRGLPTFLKSSLIRHELPVRGRVLEKLVSKATATLNITQNLVFSFHYIFLYHSLYRTWEKTRGERRDEKHLVCLYTCKFKYRQKTMEVQWLIKGRFLSTFMAKYRIVLSNLQYFIKPDIPLYGFLRQYL